MGAGGPRVPLSAANALSAWQFAPAVSAMLIAVAAGYLAGMWRVASRKTWSRLLYMVLLPLGSRRRRYGIESASAPYPRRRA